MANLSPRSDRTLKFMGDQEFEDAAALMLAEYGNQHGQVIAPPVPIDDIIEEHLGLAIEIRDLRAEYPEGDVLGAIYFSEKKIVVDQSLVPEDFPTMLGRFRFTLAHELGHWRLHRHLYLRRANERSLFPDDRPIGPNHVLRSRQYDPKEVQANRFASCLLMPREMLKREWFAWRGSMDPVYLDDLRSVQQQKHTAEIARKGAQTMGDEAIEELFERVARPLAAKFEVSLEAMRIRLEGMKLLVRVREATLFD
jgi:Zn-dependent peptidase ImmA (M78 family)